MTPNLHKPEIFPAAPRRGVAILGLLLACAGFAACASDPAPKSPPPGPPLTVVPHVDYPQYMGTWYEVARYPHAFQEDCVAATATYRLIEENEIEVVNRCREQVFNGTVREFRGVARVVDPPIQAKLKVHFWPFEGDYWIIALAPDYRYAVVSTPGRDFLWVLSRTRKMEARDFGSVLARIQELGFDLSRLKRTPQPEPAAPQDLAGLPWPEEKVSGPN